MSNTNTTFTQAGRDFADGFNESFNALAEWAQTPTGLIIRGVVGFAVVGGIGYGIYRLCTGGSSAVEAVTETAEAVRGFFN